MQLTFADRLRRLLEEHGEKQPMAARRLGYTHAWLNRVVNGDRPSREFVERVADVYKADREELLTLAGFNRTPYEDPVVQATEAAAGRLAGAIAEEAAELVVDKLRIDFAHVFREREESPRDYLIRRLGDLTLFCGERAIDFSPPRFHGGSESLTSREQVDAAIESVVAGLVEDYPEHADALRSAFGGDAADAA